MKPVSDWNYEEVRDQRGAVHHMQFGECKAKETEKCRRRKILKTFFFFSRINTRYVLGRIARRSRYIQKSNIPKDVGSEYRVPIITRSAVQPSYLTTFNNNHWLKRKEITKIQCPRSPVPDAIFFFFLFLISLIFNVRFYIRVYYNITITIAIINQQY